MIYYACLLVLDILGKYSQTKYGRAIHGAFAVFVYSVITGGIASLFFFLSSGCKIHINFATFVYALAFSLVVMVGYVATLFVVKFLDVSSVAVLTSTLSLLMSYLSGSIFLSESISVTDAIKGVMMIAASILLHFPFKKGMFKFHPAGILLAFLSACVTSSATIMSNLFANDTRVTDSNSYFFLTNVIIVIFSLFASLILKKGNFRALIKEFTTFPAKNYLHTAVVTMSSNIGSLFQILIFASGDGVIFYTPIASALVLISSGIVAILLKEKPKVIPLALACVSLFIGIF